MSIDYPVASRSEYQIQHDAQKLREFLGVENASSFHITKSIKEVFIQNFRKKGAIRLNLTDNDPSPNSPALVSFEHPENGPNRSITLNVRKDVWDRADKGEGYDRFILAHELGHILLHDYIPSHFSSTTIRILTTSPEEETAEWQANTFAKHFLVPDWLVFEHRDVASIVFACRVEADIAEDRIETVRQKNKKIWLSLNDSPCPKCSRLNLFNAGTMVSCYSCGHNTSLGSISFGKSARPKSEL